ncbi:MAG: hypothetical protein JJ863_31780 [Deltaproteobacteria bacterium]|nr:hypothetical protein [Deltaproteobacteria bacterium]
MFSSTLDSVRAIGVGLFSGLENTDQDYERYVSEIVECVKRFADAEAPVYLLVVEPDNASPGAAWRKKIAEASRGVPPQTLFLFVGGSRLTRGVVTAISWLAPRSYETKVIATWEEARALVAERRQVSEGLLDQLLESARANAGSVSASASR